MNSFDDKWARVRIGMSKQEVYAIIGLPDNVPDIGHMTVSGYDPEEFEFWNRFGRAYQCTFAYSSLRKKKIDGAEEMEAPPPAFATGPRSKFKVTTKGHCAVCGEPIPYGDKFIMAVTPPDGFSTVTTLADALGDKRAMSKLVEDNSHSCCEKCMLGVLPRWLKNAGNAGLLIVTNEIERMAGPLELCPQCLEPAGNLIWGVFRDQTRLYDWFWWCISCQTKWMYRPKDLPDSRPPYRTTEQIRQDELRIMEEQQQREKEAHIQKIMSTRQVQRRCTNCGNSLRIRDWLLGRKNHPGCENFMDSK